MKRALQFIFDFEDAALRAASQRGLDGIICGHIHSAVIREANGLTYVNCGDWVDSCTAIVEHLDGRLELVAWNGDDDNDDEEALPVVTHQIEELQCVS